MALRGVRGYQNCSYCQGTGKFQLWIPGNSPGWCEKTLRFSQGVVEYSQAFGVCRWKSVPKAFSLSRPEVAKRCNFSMRCVAVSIATYFWVWLWVPPLPERPYRVHGVHVSPKDAHWVVVGFGGSVAMPFAVAYSRFCARTSPLLSFTR